MKDNNIFLISGFYVLIQMLVLAHGQSAVGCPPGSCFNWPPGCKALNCTVVIRFYYDNSLVTIDLNAKTGGWIAFGLNEDQRIMGGSAGEVCIRNSSRQAVLKSFKTKDTDFHMTNIPSAITLIAAGYADGRLFCRYGRPIKGQQLSDMSIPWYLISSWGKVKFKDRKMHPREHATGDYFWSKSKLHLMGTGVVPATTFGWDLISVHGSLMIIAWIGLAFSGIFFARYAREVYQKDACGGNQTWFQLHRGIMIGSVVLAVIAFITILVEAKSWNTEMGAHPILGLITIILAVTQAIAGMLRPSVGSARRLIFNFAHRCGGVLTYMLAAIAIVLGLAAMDVDIVIMILYLVVIVFVCLGIEVHKFYKSRTVTEVQYRESEMRQGEADSNSSEDGTPILLSPTELIIRKGIAVFMAFFGIAIAIVLISLVAHKGYVYSQKGKV